MKKISETGEREEHLSSAAVENVNNHNVPEDLPAKQSAVNEDEKVADDAVACEDRPPKKAKNEPEMVTSFNIDNGNDCFLYCMLFIQALALC